MALKRSIMLVLAGLVLVSLATHAVAQAKRPVAIAYLALASQQVFEAYFVAFKQALEQYGWHEGSDYRIEARWANGDPTRLAPLAAELAAHSPDVVVAAPTAAVQAAAQVFPNVPIVQANGGSPVEVGLAASLGRPGGNVTGITNMIGDTSEKSLELLVAAVPNVRRVGFLFDPAPTNQSSVAAAKRSLALYKLEGAFASAATPNDIDPALATLAKDGADALVILSGGFFPTERRRIMQIAAKHRWPVVGGLREYAEDGALLAYGADRKALYRRAAYFVDRILKGVRAADLPFEQPTRFELVINMKTAKSLGLTIPQSLLLRADEVIQ
jgi:putative ABC transport system substrate-binding protein